MSQRAREHDAMAALIVEAHAAESLDRACARIASLIDPSDTDEGMERVQTRITVAVRDALIHVARAEGWTAPRGSFARGGVLPPGTRLYLPGEG